MRAVLKRNDQKRRNQFDFCLEGHKIKQLIYLVWPGEQLIWLIVI